jgi:hypothetical protein
MAGTIAERDVPEVYRYKVSALKIPSTDETNLGCEWRYADNVQAGMDVRIFDRSQNRPPEQA